MELDRVGFLLLVLLIGGYLGWFVLGGQYNRRRAAQLAQWVYRGIQPFGGKASIRWLTTHAFELFVEQTQRPFSAVKVTGLLESRDMLVIWLYNRLTYRPDLLLLRGNLRSSQ